MSFSQNAWIHLKGVSQNNLKHLSIQIPLQKWTTLTGPSGSGKSSLAFETLYAEGQRRYLETLSTSIRQFLEKMPEPTLETLNHIPPAIAIEQKNPILSARSTVGSLSEISQDLQKLFAHFGTPMCPQCKIQGKHFKTQDMVSHVGSLLCKQSLSISACWRPSSTLSFEQTLSLLQIFSEEGIVRFLWKKNPSHAEPIRTQDLLQKASQSAFQKKLSAALKNKALYIVLDRIQKTSSLSSSLKTRLFEAVERGLRFSKTITLWSSSGDQIQNLSSFLSCPQCEKKLPVPKIELFSFKHPLGACPQCQGFGFKLHLDESLVVPDPTQTLEAGAINPLHKPTAHKWEQALFQMLKKNKISLQKRYQELIPYEKKLIWEGDPSFPKYLGIYGCFQTLKRWKYKLHVRVFIRRYQNPVVCSLCLGTRLKEASSWIFLNHFSFPEIQKKSIQEVMLWLKNLSEQSFQNQNLFQELFESTAKKLERLIQLGLGYLSLDRQSKTLSGGEFQKIQLANQLSHGLSETLYILDEPTIGLHTRDHQALKKVLKNLTEQGNTVVVVEHDLDMIQSAHWVLELGPGAGVRGGSLLFQNTQEAFQKANTPTANMLQKRTSLFKRALPLRNPSKHFLYLKNCIQNNLKNIEVKFPLEQLSVVTGVSGSGKTSLIHYTLYEVLSKYLSKKPFPHSYRPPLKSIEGLESLKQVVLLDQKPIGKSTRSNPATFLKIWDEIRKIYATQFLARQRGYQPGHFSFNVDAGRCPECQGSGEKTVEMHFIAPVQIPCESCQGKRFQKEILEVTYQGKNISELLKTTVEESYFLFQNEPAISKKLKLLKKIGLHYLELGQSALTLSGGEAQRLKIAKALLKKKGGTTLYLFDEPTTGLSLKESLSLFQLFHELIDQGHTVIVIEHQLEILFQADWVLDLGPEGGDQGGNIIFEGRFEDFLAHPTSYTAKALRALKNKKIK